MKRIYLVILVILLVALTGCAAASAEQDAMLELSGTPVIVNATELGKYKLTTNTGEVHISTGGSLSTGVFSIADLKDTQTPLKSAELKSSKDVLIFSGLSDDIDYVITVQGADTAELESALIKLSDN